MNPDWLREQAQINKLRQEHPDWCQLVGHFTHQDILPHIGISGVPTDLPEGYLRFRPEDFIVEEINSDGSVVTIEPTGAGFQDTPDHRTLYSTLVKIGLSTHEALDRLADGLHINRRQIGHAGLKDTGAITAQRISLRGITHEAAAALQLDQLLLKDFQYGSGALSPGDCRGNRFTLTIRTAQAIDESWWRERWSKISQGIPNFYGTQRFGNRLLSHYFGRSLVRGDFTGAIKQFLTDTNASERNYIADVRARVGDQWGDWAAVIAMLNEWPYTLRHELTVAKHLAQHPDDWVGALAAVSDQTKLWVYAYMSYLVNRLLSALAAENKDLPSRVPIPLSHERSDRELYQGFLEADDVPLDFIDKLRPLRFIRPAARSLTSLLKPELLGSKAVQPGVVVSFDLPTGAYATTVIMQLFTIVGGQPAPTWLQPDQLDPKSILGNGTIQPLFERWGDLMKPREQLAETDS